MFPEDLNLKPEEALLQIKKVIENSQVVLFAWRNEAGWPIEFVTENIAQFGYQAQECFKQKICYSDLIYPDDLGQIKQEVIKKIAEGQKTFCLKYRILTKGGEVRWVDSSNTVIINGSEDQIISIQGTVLDITDRKLAETNLQADNNISREKLHRSRSARGAIVQVLMNALGERDLGTGEHAERLQDLIILLATACNLPECDLSDLRLLAQFHDIGKVAVPDHILFKSGILNAEEVLEMQRHCEIGYRIALSVPDLMPIADWILMHHEWWNGDGYPLGLKGEEIPLECRLLAVVDAYDAMTSDRPYRKAMTHEDALREIRRQAGIQFDSEIVRVLLQIEK